MVDLARVQAQVPRLDIQRLKANGLVIIYDDVDGRLGAAAVRQIVNVIVANHPASNELFQVEVAEETSEEISPDEPVGMTFMVDIPSIRLIPSSSAELELELEHEDEAVLDLRRSALL